MATAFNLLSPGRRLALFFPFTVAVVVFGCVGSALIWVGADWQIPFVSLTALGLVAMWFTGLVLFSTAQEVDIQPREIQFGTFLGRVRIPQGELREASSDPFSFGRLRLRGPGGMVLLPRAARGFPEVLTALRAQNPQIDQAPRSDSSMRK